MTALESLYPRLTQELATLLGDLSGKDAAAMEEIRIYVNRPVELVIAGRRRRTGLAVDKAGMDRLLAALSGYAIYRFEREMAEGYLPLEGGHRAGVCGAMTRLEDGSWNMRDVTSVCIRLARHVAGVSIPIRSQLFAANGRARRILIFGPPGCGKTTVLRDAALHMAKYIHTAVVDERGELFAQEADADQGCLDVLSGMNKAKAFSMLIRSMSPDVIVCDELGRDEDVGAMIDAARCGVGVLASAHADGLDDLLARPLMRSLFDADTFERFIHLGRHGSVRGIWDGSGRWLEKEENTDYGELGNGCDGDDRREQRRISLVGRGKEARALGSGDAQMSFASGCPHTL